METTRYIDQQGCKSRQKIMRHYMRWQRPMSERFVKLPYSIISRATSIDLYGGRFSTPSVLSNKADQLRSNKFDQEDQEISQGRISYRSKNSGNTNVHGGGGLELVKPVHEPVSSRPKPCAPLKKPHESCPFATPCCPLKDKNRQWSEINFFFQKPYCSRL